MLLYFIRHGQTDWNKDMRMQGQSDIPLNENGRESAIEAGKTLANTHIDLAFSSPLKRAKETAELVLAGRDRKSTRLNSSHDRQPRMPSSA